jgi:hypothetical protein
VHQSVYRSCASIKDNNANTIYVARYVDCEVFPQRECLTRIYSFAPHLYLCCKTTWLHIQGTSDTVDNSVSRRQCRNFLRLPSIIQGAFVILQRLSHNFRSQRASALIYIGNKSAKRPKPQKPPGASTFLSLLPPTSITRTHLPDLRLHKPSAISDLVRQNSLASNLTQTPDLILHKPSAISDLVRQNSLASNFTQAPDFRLYISSAVSDLVRQNSLASNLT